MKSHPSLWGRLLCHVHGEVSANMLEAYRRASLAVYDLMTQVETQRQQCLNRDVDPWALSVASQSEMLCAWNAFVLQNLGDCLLDADYRHKPATAGFVPPRTAEQILAFYSQVEIWLNLAQQAHSNPAYRLDLEVPAELPPWIAPDPKNNSHLYGLFEAMIRIRDKAGVEMRFFEETAKSVTVQHLSELHVLRQLFAAVSTKTRYAEDLFGAKPSEQVMAQVEPHIKAAIEQWYHLGQLLAMPGVICDSKNPVGNALAKGMDNWKQPVCPEDVATSLATPQRRLIKRRRPKPGEPGFSPWCLTDHATRDEWKRDRKAQQAIKLLWSLDPDPSQTQAVQTEIEAAFKRGDIGYALDRYSQRLGHFFMCPWGSIYVVKRRIIIAGQELRTLQEFVFHVSAKGIKNGYPFKREIMTGTFQPTSKTDYGDPDSRVDL